MDKTGTITRGKPEVVDIKCFNGFNEEALTMLSDKTVIKEHARLLNTFQPYSCALLFVFGYIISSTMPYSFASSADIKKSRSRSSLIFSTGWPVRSL